MKKIMILVSAMMLCFAISAAAQSNNGSRDPRTSQSSSTSRPTRATSNDYKPSYRNSTPTSRPSSSSSTSSSSRNNNATVQRDAKQGANSGYRPAPRRD